MSLDHDPVLKSDRHIDDEIRQEFALHIELLVAELEENGWSSAAALEEAQRRFGDLPRHRAECRVVQRRRRESARWRGYWSGWSADLRLAIRALRRHPSSSFATVVTLSASIAAAALVFALVNGVLLQPLRAPQPERLVALAGLERETGEREFVSPANFVDWRENTRSFAGMAAYSSARYTMTGHGDPRLISAVEVSEDFFPVLGMAPYLGRWLDNTDIRDEELVVVISDGFWRRETDADPDILARSLNLDGRDHRVVGVMPRGFGLPEFAEIWTPLFWNFDLAGSRGAQYLVVIARLADEVTPQAADLELDNVALSLEKSYPEKNAGRGILLEPLRASLVDGVRRPLLILLAAVGCVLLLGIVNAAALLLAQGLAKTKERAVLRALGASTWRLTRSLFIEASMPSLLGAALGTSLAYGGLRLLKSSAWVTLPRLAETKISAPVIGLAVLAALISAACAAAWLAWRATTRESGLNASSTPPPARRARISLIATEVALACVVTIGAGLFAKSLLRATHVDMGFEAKERIGFRLSLPESRYDTTDKGVAFFDELERRLVSFSAVQEVGMTPWLPPDWGWFFSYTILGEEPPPPNRQPSAVFRVVNDRYFASLEIPSLAGRTFNETDRGDSTAAVIVNQAFVTRNFPDGRGLDRRITVGFGNPNKNAPIERTIIGVVANSRMFGQTGPELPTVFFSRRQVPFTSMAFILQPKPGQHGTVDWNKKIRATVAELDSNLAIQDLGPLDERIDASLKPRRFIVGLMSSFALLALLIAAAGIYGSFSQSVALRRREWGIRLAIGAHRGQLMRRIIAGALVAGGIGAVVGGIGAAALGRLLKANLFEVSAYDPTTYALVAGVLLAVAMLASWIPASRASHTDPVIALRAEG